MKLQNCLVLLIPVDKDVSNILSNSPLELFSAASKMSLLKVQVSNLCEINFIIGLSPFPSKSFEALG